MHSIDYPGTGGLRLTADVLGNLRDPPIVFLPGAGQTRHAWRRAVAVAAELGQYVISLDLRGHGDSAWAPDGDYSLDAFVGDLLAVVATLPSLPILVGASIGGIASLVAAGESPVPLARGLVLVDVVPSMPGAGLDRIRAFMSAGGAGFATVDEAAAVISRYLPSRWRPGTNEGLRNNLRRGDDGRFYWHWDPAFHAGSAQRAAAGMLERMERATSGIRFPTLLVSGAQSEVVNHEGVAHLLTLIPQATWTQVAGAAHMVAGDKNDAFNAALGDFINRLSISTPVIS